MKDLSRFIFNSILLIAIVVVMMVIYGSRNFVEIVDQDLFANNINYVEVVYREQYLNDLGTKLIVSDKLKIQQIIGIFDKNTYLYSGGSHMYNGESYIVKIYFYDGTDLIIQTFGDKYINIEIKEDRYTVYRLDEGELNYEFLRLLYEG